MKQKRYSLTELIKRWGREELTTEQAIGQIFLWLIALAERIARLEANQLKSQQSKEE